MKKKTLVFLLLFLTLIMGCGDKSQPENYENDSNIAVYSKEKTIDVLINGESVRSVYCAPTGSLCCIETDMDGNIAIREYYSDNSEPMEFATPVGDYYLFSTWSMDGTPTVLTIDEEDYILNIYSGKNLQKTVRFLRENIAGDYPFFACFLQGEGCLFMTHSSIALFNDLGEKVKEKKYSPNEIYQAMQMSDGSVYIFTGSDNSKNIACLDIKTLEPIKKTTIDCEPVIFGEKEGKCIFSEGRDIYSFDTGNYCVDILCHLDNQYLRSDCIRGISFAEENMAIVYYDEMNYPGNVKVILFKEGLENTANSSAKEEFDEEGRRIIYIYSPSGKTYIKGCIGEAIANFNIDSKDYSVRIIEEQADIDIAIDNDLNPDIFFSATPSSIASYANKGYLEDLWPFIENSVELEKEDINDAIRKLYEIGGSLYGITNEISVKGIRLSDADFDGSWTIEEFLEWLKKNKDVRNEAGFSRAYVVNLCLTGLVNDNVDFEEGKAYFDNERFEDILNSLSELSFEKESEEGVYIYDVSGVSEVRQHPYIATGTIGSVENMAREEALVGRDISFIGYPSNQDVARGILSPLANVAIVADSKCKEGAYAFIEYWLNRQRKQIEIYGRNSEKNEYARGTFYSLNSIFEANIKAGMGERAIIIGGASGEDSKIQFTVTEEHVTRAKEILSNAQVESYEEVQIKNIVSEEITNYFNGSMEEKMVAKVIQGRVQLFLDETR